MQILPSATESSLVTLLTYHPTMSTLLAVIGVVVILSIAIMTISVLLRKKFAEPRPPEKWDRSEVFIMSMFLHAWQLRFIHPAHQQDVQLQAELPQTLQEWLLQCTRGAIDNAQT